MPHQRAGHGHGQQGSPGQAAGSTGYEREARHGHSRAQQIDNQAASFVKAAGMSVSGTRLLKHEPGDSHSNDKVWTVEVRGDQVLVAWGKVETQLATTTKLFPDALLAEKWAAETVAEKIKAGYAVDESEATA
jgi:predicted DNA-binding WGR domain protein